MARTVELLVGFDLGTKFGYAVAKNGKLIDELCGTWNLAGRPKTKNFPADPAWWRMKKLEAHISSLILSLPRYSSLTFVFESIDRKQGFSGSANRVLYALEATMLSTLGAFGFEPIPYPVSTWKKLATGNGKADQAKYIKAANDRWGLDLGEKDDNTAVAVNLISAHIRKKRAEARG
jgi:hypothetical protein